MDTPTLFTQADAEFDRCIKRRGEALANMRREGAGTPESALVCARNVGGVFPFVGLNTYSGLIIVYLGGAMGVNTWLMKGFFDTIPAELDESARVDGATPAQVFWGVVLPLAAPVLAVIALISFISTLNEFVIASVILETQHRFTLPVGLWQFIDQKYSEHWGPFAAGVLIAAIPAALLFAFLQRYIVQGLTQGAVKG